jgi:hypothetical protein
MISEDSNSDNDNSDASANALEQARQAETPARERLRLMRQLQASLSCSHRALLTQDLTGIEQATQEQLVLSRNLEAEIQQMRTGPAAARLARNRSASNRLASDSAISFAGCAPELAEELRRSERTVLQALRLQSALLVRTQHKLRVLANMLADPAIDYGPLLARRDGIPLASACKRGGSIPDRQGLKPCRA